MNLAYLICFLMDQLGRDLWFWVKIFDIAHWFQIFKMSFHFSGHKILLKITNLCKLIATQWCWMPTHRHSYEAVSKCSLAELLAWRQTLHRVEAHLGHLYASCINILQAQFFCIKNSTESVFICPFCFAIHHPVVLTCKISTQWALLNLI